MIDLSVVILNYNMKGLVKQCVRGVANYGASCSTEVIVVDNASVDGSLSQFRQWEQEQPFPTLSFRFVSRTQNDGYAVGNNEGIRQARGALVLILNPDIAVMPGSVESLMRHLEFHPSAAAVGPKLLNPDKTIQYSCYKFPSLMTPLYRRTLLSRSVAGTQHVRDYMMTDWDHATHKPVDWIMGSAMLLRRSAIEHIGGFDERFFMYYEDIDWCRRFWHAGYEVHYVPDSVMVHYHQRLSAQNGIKNFSSWATRTHIRSALQYFYKYSGRPLPVR